MVRLTKYAPAGMKTAYANIWKAWLIYTTAILGAMSIRRCLMKNAMPEMRRRFFTGIFCIILVISAIVGSYSNAAPLTAIPICVSVPPKGVMTWIM